MWYTVDIVEKTRPKYVVWENVKNVLSAKNRHNFDDYIQVMEDLGYNSYYQVLNAKNYGVPQNRERVFTISIRKDIDTGYEFPEGFKLKLKLKDVLEKSVDEKYYLSDKTISDFITDTKNDIKIIGKLDIKGHDCIKRVYDVEGIAPTLTDMQGGHRQPKILERELEYPYIAASRGRNPDRPGDRTPGIPTEQRLEPNKLGISNTITSVQKDNYVVEGRERIRKLTPRECWRLMGFADEDFDKAEAVPTSNTQLYKQAGNSIVVNVLEAIFKNLFYKEVEKDEN